MAHEEQGTFGSEPGMMKTQGVKIERVFDKNNNIVEYRAIHPGIRDTARVPRAWAEDQVLRGKAYYVDIGRKPYP